MGSFDTSRTQIAARRAAAEFEMSVFEAGGVAQQRRWKWAIAFGWIPTSDLGIQPYNPVRDRFARRGSEYRVARNAVKDYASTYNLQSSRFCARSHYNSPRLRRRCVSGVSTGRIIS